MEKQLRELDDILNEISDIRNIYNDKLLDADKNDPNTHSYSFEIMDNPNYKNDNVIKTWIIEKNNFDECLRFTQLLQNKIELFEVDMSIYDKYSNVTPLYYVITYSHEKS